MARKSSLVDRLGKLPPGMSKADVEAIMEFLYGAFGRKAARETIILHPYLDENPPQLTVSQFVRWLQLANQQN